MTWILWLVFAVNQSAIAMGLEFERHLYLGAWSPFATFWEVQTPVCAWTEMDVVGYRIIAMNHDASTSFELTNEIGNSIQYSVFWLSDSNASSGEQLQHGVPSRQTYLFNQGYGCGISKKPHMRIRVNKVDFDAAAPGIYNGILMLMLSPI